MAVPKTDAKPIDHLAVFSANVRRISRAQGITQDQIAEACGLPQPTISLIMRGLREPKLLTVIKMSEILKVDLADLICESKSITSRM